MKAIIGIFVKNILSNFATKLPATQSWHFWQPLLFLYLLYSLISLVDTAT